MTRRRWQLGAAGLGAAVLALGSTACGSSSPTAAAPETVSSAGASQPAVADVGSTSSTSTGSAGSAGTLPSIPAGQQVNLKFLTYLPGALATGGATVNTLISGFEAAHPNIHVTVQAAYPTLPALQQDEAAGATPDVVQGTFDGWKYLVSGLGGQNLTKLVGQPAIDAEWAGEYPYAEPVRKLAMQGGDVYGIPWTLSTPVLFYNANLFQKAGLDPTKPPSTWAELKADAAKIKVATSADGLVNGCLGSAGAGSDWCLQGLIASDGGRVLSADGDSLALDSPGTADALTTMQDLANSGAMVNLTSTQAIQEFGTNKLAMILNTSALQSTLLSAAAGGKFTLLDGAMPGFGSKPTAPTNSGSGLFITSKSPIQQAAAWELIRYLTSEASMTTIAEKIGYVPLRPGIADSTKYLAEWKKSNGLVTPNIAQLNRLVAYQGYPGPNYTQIVTTVANAATAVIFNHGAADQVLKTAQSQASALLP